MRTTQCMTADELIQWLQEQRNELLNEAKAIYDRMLTNGVLAKYLETKRIASSITDTLQHIGALINTDAQTA